MDAVMLDRLRSLTEKLEAADNERYLSRHILDSLPDAILVVREDGRIIRANLQASILLACTPEELLHAHVEDFIPEAVRAAHAEHRARYIAEPATRAMAVGRTVRARRADGREIPVYVELAGIRSAAGLLTRAVIREVPA